MKKFILILSLNWFLAVQIHSQVTYNSYAAISNIAGTTMTVTNLTETPSFSFTAGGNLLIMQMQDNVIGSNTSNNTSFGNLGSNGSAGLWEQRTISSITRSGTTATIVLTAAPSGYNLGANSVVQVISFPLLNAAAYSTTANITGTAWNGTIGGVVAFEVGTILTLNNNISANALGFRGGSVSVNYYGGGTTCSTIDYGGVSTASNCGNKGEGIYKATTITYTYGMGHILNGGGGGGQDINGGGGGGGNWTAGGNGGPGWNGSAAGCTAPSAAGIGGIALSSLIPLNRIFMGGGGGGGQQNNSTSSAGGRGGGIVVVKAGTLVTTGTCGTPRLISANGATAALSGNDGCGGAGAGGSIVLQIGSFGVVSACQLSITANGASGGTVNTSTHAGGGPGGQGIVVFSIAQPTANITTQTNNGSPGCNNNSVPCNNTTPSAGGSNGSGIIPNIGGNLPIELMSFNAKKNGQNVSLEWVTQTESYNDYFTIERSLNGIDFIGIEIIKTKARNGDSRSPLTYTTFDPSPDPGTTYYRLKQTDKDGMFKYYHPVSVKFDKVNSISISVFPNPNKGEFTLNISGLSTGSDIEVNVVDISGKVVYNSLLQNSVQNNTIKISPKERLTPGVYVCKVQANGINYPVKVIVQ